MAIRQYQASCCATSRGVAGLGGDPLLEDGCDAGGPLEEEALDQADHQPEQDRAQRAREADEDRAAHHVEVSAAFEQASGFGGRRGQSGEPSWGVEARRKLAPGAANAGFPGRAW